MSFSIGIIAVLVSVRHLEVGVKKSPRPGQQAIRNSNRNEWSPIRSVIITSLKQNWMSTKHESNLLSRVIITDRIERHEVLL